MKTFDITKTIGLVLVLAFCLSQPQYSFSRKVNNSKSYNGTKKTDKTLRGMLVSNTTSSKGVGITPSGGTTSSSGTKKSTSKPKTKGEATGKFAPSPVTKSFANQAQTPGESTSGQTSGTPSQEASQGINADAFVYNFSDTVYAYDTKKQHGWLAPLDTIAKEVAAHRALTYRFTCRNAQGNWCKVETINGYGGHNPGQLDLYILDLSNANAGSDSLADEGWVQRLNTACVYEFLPDPTGKTVMQERAYDASGDIVYVYTRTPIGKDKNGRDRYIGSYKDSNGLPAEMRKDATGTYGTLVRLTEDRWGNDSIVEFIDAKGNRKINADGAAMGVFVYNKAGELRKQQSCDSLGKLIIDDWGNCGVEYKYNKDHTVASATFMDDNWQPMRMPDKRSVDNEQVIQKRFAYDKYKRMTAESYHLADGTPDDNKKGPHKQVATYDDHGNVTQNCYFDIEGKITNGKEDLAIITYSYDSLGRLEETRWLDQERRPRVSDTYISKLKYAYNSDGGQILEERYSGTENGGEVLYYKNEKTPDREYTLWSDGTSRVDSLDNKGRTIFVGFYGKDGKPEMTGGRAFERYTYQDYENVTVAREIDYDEKGQKVDVNGVCETVAKYDSIKWTCTQWRYDAKGNLNETLITRYTPDFEMFIGQDDANAFGHITRSGGSSSTRFYKCDVARNGAGEYISFCGRDEFGDKDYIDGSSLYCYSKFLNNSKVKYYDEDGKEIDDSDELRDSLAKVMSIEVVDSAAYARGLRDNDVILLYGDYAANLDTIVTYQEFLTNWTLRSVIDARKNKRLVVFRIEDASNNKYGLVEINGLQGTASELGFITHERYLTKKQKARIVRAIEENISSEAPLLTKADLHKPNNKGGGNRVLMAYPDLYRSRRTYAYARQVADPAICLGACFKGRHIRWTEDEDVDNFVDVFMTVESSDSEHCPTRNFFLTKDAASVTPLTLTEKSVGAYWFFDYISDEDYAQISSLYQEAANKVDSLCPKKKPTVDKRFVGYWEIQGSLQYGTNTNYPINGHLNLTKKGEAEGEIVNYGQIIFNEGCFYFKITRSFEGKWQTDGNWLYLPFVSNDDVAIECIDIVGNVTNKQELIDYVNTNWCREYKDETLSRVRYMTENIESNVCLLSFDADTVITCDSTIIVKTGKARPITKKKPKIVATQIASSNGNEQEEDNPLLGYWTSTISSEDEVDVQMTLSLFADSTMSANIYAQSTMPVNDSASVRSSFDLDCMGTWNFNNGNLTINSDITNFGVDMYCKFQGLDAAEEEEARQLAEQQFADSKQELAKAFSAPLQVEESPVTYIDSDGFVFGDVRWQRLPYSYSVVVAEVDSAVSSSYMMKNGYEGSFVVLEWCDWHCEQGIDKFIASVDEYRDKEKHLVLLPGENVDGEDVFKEVIEINNLQGLVGVTFREKEVNYWSYFDQILKRYRKWKDDAKYRDIYKKQ